MKFSEHMRISKRALQMMWQRQRAYFVYLVSHSILQAVAPYVPIYFSAKLIDALVVGAPLPEMILYVALTVGLTFLIQGILAWIAPRMNSAQRNCYRDEEWWYSEKAMQLAYESIENTEVSLLRNRIRNESHTGFNLRFIHRTIRATVSDVTMIVCSVGLCFSFFFAPAIPLYAKLGIVVLLIATILVGIFCSLRSQKVSNALWDECVHINMLDEKYNDYIDSYKMGKDIRLYAMKESILSRMKDLDEELRQKFLKYSVKFSLANTPKALMEDILKLCTNLFLISAAIAGAVSVGSISKYVSSILKLIGAISDFVRTIQIALNNNMYLDRYFSYFDIPNNMYQGSLTVEKRDDNEYYVEFRDVSFKYPNSDMWALRHVNLKFKVGEKLAVVGMNGSGKTTFIKLLCRLYDPTEGEILLNGVNIQKYDYDEYMSVFSVVFQDFSLFSFKIGEVVASSKTFDENKVRECLQKANFGDRLHEMPEDVHTYLYKGYDQSGIEISGGEAQKIALARALYKDSPFILLDEPTAALDPISEYEVYSNFNAISGDKTTVYISHRLASCRFCNKIVVFDNGHIVQHGSHEELLSDVSGKYHELWNAQAQYYTT